MLTKQEFSKSFKSLLEKIIFDRTNLDNLKEAVKLFQEGKITVKQFKKKLLLDKVNIMEELLEIFPHYVHSIQVFEGNGKKPKVNSNNSQIKTLKTKLHEREELLKIIARRLQELTTEHFHSRSEKKYTKLTNKTFILDGSNIARHNQNSKKASINDVIGTKKVLLKAGILEEDIFIIFGSGLHHYISEEDRSLYDNLLQKRNNVQAPAGADDDWFIIQHGLKHNSYIITNDLYSKYKEKGEEYQDYIENHSIRYSIIGNDIYFEKELETL